MSALATYSTIAEIRGAVTDSRSAARRIGFVPTMGALHEGHGVLIARAAAECDFVVVSIFVNPTQFGPNEDFSRYPRSFDADQELCARCGASAIFAPHVAEMYPPTFKTHVEVSRLQDELCGASRPGHFRGVCTVVMKLFQIVQADIAYFGQKDAQQLLIIERMVADLCVPITIRAIPTVREPDGLAMSSRNRYLSTEERRVAPEFHRILQSGRQLIEAGERDAYVVEEAMARDLSANPMFRADYLRVVRAEDLRSPSPIAGRTLIAGAVFLGTTRLIDNILIDV